MKLSQRKVWGEIWTNYLHVDTEVTSSKIKLLPQRTLVLN